MDFLFMLLIIANNWGNKKMEGKKGLTHPHGIGQPSFLAFHTLIFLGNKGEIYRNGTLNSRLNNNIIIIQKTLGYPSIFDFIV
ncbi:MAG: hypothetical protein Q8906_07550 [Bacillota bacterium]|nr:hypothetical protein [Bacillota bacterium]